MDFRFSCASPRRALIVTALSAALLLPATASFAASLSAATGTVIGTVTCGPDETTAAPNARIAVDGMNLSTTADAAGKFTLPNVPSGQMLDIDALGDSSGSVSTTRYNVSVVADAVTDIGNLDLVVCPQQQSIDTSAQPNQWSPDLQGNLY